MYMVSFRCCLGTVLFRYCVTACRYYYCSLEFCAYFLLILICPRACRPSRRRPFLVNVMFGRDQRDVPV